MGQITRRGEISRSTKETDVQLTLNLDGSGSHQVDSGLPFLDHMLSLLAVHSLCDLALLAKGDIQVDDHHTVEDIGICLGQALLAALGDKEAINRYGEATVPMDEALVRVVIDLSGRPHLVYVVPVKPVRLGGLALENVKEFFQALANNAGMNIHIDLLRGENSHHIVEAIFKAFARALRQAIALEPRVKGVWSSKGQL